MRLFRRNSFTSVGHLWLLLALFFAPLSFAAVYELPADGSSVVGTDTHIKTVYKDTLLDIARRNSLGYYEIIRANPGVDMWLPGEGTDVMLPGRRILPPGPREGIVVNLAEHRLYYYPKPKKGEKPVVITYPVSIGKMDWKTPLGETRVIQKEKHPVWIPTESVRKEHIANGDPLPPGPVKAGPDNPLGDYAMRLAAGNGTYLIHGTNNPMAVGMAITHGCIRMYPEDVAALFPLIPVGTKVWLINEPVKVAFVNGELFVEAHPPVDDEGQNTAEPDMQLLSQKLDQALGNTTTAINWDLAKETLQAANGIPTVVGLQADMDPQQAAAAIQSGTPDAPAPTSGGGAAPPSATTTAPSATTTAPASATSADATSATTAPAVSTQTGAATTSSSVTTMRGAASPTNADTTASPATPARAAGNRTDAAQSSVEAEPQQHDSAPAKATESSTPAAQASPPAEAAAVPPTAAVSPRN
jgi:L,D-transpeptidase ErfK/SrfK